MLLRKLILTNFGLFSGRNEFDLVPRCKGGHLRPVVLFGGKNGAGKTTILESIRLALYGRLSLGARVRTIDYDSFLRSRIHRSSSDNVQASSAAIAIEFDYVHRGEVDRYLIERAWNHARKESIDETLSVTKNGLPLDEVDAEVWPSFVRDIIPEELAQLFFFDGEKIQELAEDATGSGALADSIKSLLGLDLVERLDADLTVYASRQVAQMGSPADQARASQLQLDLTRLESSIALSREELASIRTRTDGVHAELRRAEEHLRREGEDLARRRERLQQERSNLLVKLETAQRAVRDQCDHLFPLSLCPKTAKDLSKQLREEQATAQAAEVRSALLQVRTKLLRAISAKRSGKGAIGTSGVASATSTINSIFEANMPEAASVILHGLSEFEARKALTSLNEARTQSSSVVKKLCMDIERWVARLAIIERNLAQIPADEALAPRVEAIAELQRRIGGLDQAKTESEERVKRHEIDAEQVRRELRQLTERYQAAGEASTKISLARTVQSALADYLRELTARKVAQLRDAVAACFNKLSRKGDLIARVEIDPQTFVVTLYDKAGSAVPKDELSSGEKQMFAIAMLWGLAKTSGRPLPVIIDTPLGRLDSEHRKKLIHDYLPFASHQVIVLSTDTEVDQSLFEELHSEISHAYHLEFVPEERRTEVAKGYFWVQPKGVPCLT